MTFLIQQTLIYAVPLMIVALAGVFAERSGIINLALEGIMIFGAFIGVLFVRQMQGLELAMASKPDFDPNAPLDFSENLAYLNEQVNAEPEIYTIYKKDANGNYLRDEQGKKIPEEVRRM